MRKALFILWLICLFIFCPSQWVKTIYAQTPDTINLQLKWKHQFQFAGNYAAHIKGFYAEEGLYVNIIEAKDNTDVIEEVNTGRADIGIATSDILIARNSGIPVVVIANIFQHSPYIFLTLSKDEVDNIHDLSGKSIMLENHAGELLAYLKTEQIDINNIDFVPHTYSPEGLIEGDVYAISAYLTDEPFRLVEQNIRYNTFNPRSSGIDFYGDLLFTTESKLKDNPALIQKFLHATKRGWVYALENKEEIIQIIHSNYSNRHSVEHLRFEADKTERLIVPNVIEVGYINRDRWQRIGEIYSELGMIPKDFTISGFLMENDNEQNTQKFYLIIVGVIIFAIVITLVAVRFYRLNRKLEIESAERQRLIEEVSAASNYKDRLFSIISHDLKGPIGTLNSFMEILTNKNNELSPEKQNQLLLKFKDSLASTYEMMHMLLLWSLNQKDQKKINIKLNNIFDVISKNIQLVNAKAERKSVTFQVNCRENAVFLFDLDMIDIVIRNLIENSIKYSRESSVVKMTVQIRKSEMIFSIEDTGVGIKKEDMYGLFEFEGSEPGTKGEKGSGLGLVLCKEFIDSHNGKIWARSKIGEGSTFSFRIPASTNP